MAPARRAARRDQAQHPPQPQNAVVHGGAPPGADEPNVNDELFLDPLMGTPLAIYVEKDVENRQEVVDLILVRLPRSCMARACAPLDASWAGGALGGLFVCARQRLDASGRGVGSLRAMRYVPPEECSFRNPEYRNVVGWCLRDTQGWLTS